MDDKEKLMHFKNIKGYISFGLAGAKQDTPRGIRNGRPRGGRVEFELEDGLTNVKSRSKIIKIDSEV